MEELTHSLQAMRRNYLFSGLDDTQYHDIVSHAEQVNLDAGEILFTQGDPVHAFYWVADGLVRLYRVSPHGDEKVIELIPPFRYFAEAALFMGGRFPVYAAAQVPTRLVAIDSMHFRAWLSHDVERCLRLMAGMSARLHSLIKEIDSLTLMKGTDRLLQYLLDHSDPDESGELIVELEAPKQVIASLIGVKPETLSRMLHKLTDMGYIEVRGNHLKILNEDGLRGANI